MDANTESASDSLDTLRDANVAMRRALSRGTAWLPGHMAPRDGQDILAWMGEDELGRDLGTDVVSWDARRMAFTDAEGKPCDVVEFQYIDRQGR